MNAITRVNVHEHVAFIGLGSNVGDRERNLYEALHDLHRAPHIHVERCSSIYETEPVGFAEQDFFLNMAAEISTSLSPTQLLFAMQQIESDLGRVRSVKWGPRTIDLDLLLYDQEQIETDYLTIPHPRMWERSFVLIPLRELLSQNGKANEKAMDLKYDKIDRKGVVLWKHTDWHNELEHSGN